MDSFVLLTSKKKPIPLKRKEGAGCGPDSFLILVIKLIAMAEP